MYKKFKNKKNSKKFNNIKIRLFFINNRKKIISYKIRFLKNVKIHYIFYVLLLKSMDPKISI